MPLLTITHCAGCRGAEIARRVADTLETALFDDSALQALALEKGILARDLENYSERAPGLLDRLLSRRPQLFLDFLQSVIYEVSRRGEGVIVGHGSQVLLRDFGCAFHVRIQAPETVRAETLAAAQGLAPDDALRLVRKMDAAARDFIRYAHRLDLNDPSLYDLVINTGKLGAETAAHLIAETFRSNDISTCGLDALEAMERHALEKKIHAVLLENGISLFTLDIGVPENGIVHVSGLANSLDEQDRIPSLVRKVPGVTAVVSTVSLRSRN
jgi:cytidylate kinase